MKRLSNTNVGRRLTYVRVLKIKKNIGNAIICAAVSDGKEKSKIDLLIICRTPFPLKGDNVE